MSPSYHPSLEAAIARAVVPMSPSYHPSLEAAIARAVVRRHHTGLPFYTYHTYTGLPFYIHYTYTCSTDSTCSTCSTCSTTLALLSRCACTTWAYAWSCATSERSTRGPSRASRAPSPQSATSEPPPPGASLHAQHVQLCDFKEGSSASLDCAAGNTAHGMRVSSGLWP